MRPPYITLRDPDLTHQLVIFTPGGSSSIAVSCNCRGEESKFGKENYSPMGYSQNLDETRELYNNPKNHLRPFTDEDKVKW